MNRIADATVIIQTSSQSFPSTPGWLGEVVLIVEYLRKQGVLEAICERVRFARRRMGHYEVIDFVAVLFGYAISGERTLEGFYQALRPFGEPLMALFGRDRLPSRSALSRFLKSLHPVVVEDLRTLFLDDLLARPLCREEPEAGLLDRQGKRWTIFDVDGTREAARQRALPKGADLPAPERRLSEVCAPGYSGRKRGQVVRTRTVVSQSHSHQWLGSFGNRGNGRSREELHLAVSAIESYLAAHHLPKTAALLRLDGQYGTRAVLRDLAAFAVVTRGKDYAVLECPEVQTRLHLPADATFTRPESTLVRTLYDCPDVAVGPEGMGCRVVVATHRTGQSKRRIGLSRDGVVYELFLTTLPQQGFTAADVVALYLHRGAFEPHLCDEDQELDPDRWWSHTPAGQEAWQIIAQWIWNLRLILGHQLCSTPLRTTEFAPALSWEQAEQGYGPPVVGDTWKAGRFWGEDFTLQPDGTVCCPAGKRLLPCERRVERGASLRIVYAARIADCRACPKREQCQWHGKEAAKPRRMSVLLHPLAAGNLPLLWRDWPRREHRRACMQLLRRERVEVRMPPDASLHTKTPPAVLSRAKLAHSRLSWQERLARNARSPGEGMPTITLFGIPEQFTAFLGLKAL